MLDPRHDGVQRGPSGQYGRPHCRIPPPKTVQYSVARKPTILRRGPKSSSTGIRVMTDANLAKCTGTMIMPALGLWRT